MVYLRRAIVEALIFFEKSVLMNDGGPSILMEIGFVDTSCQDTCDLERADLSITLRNAVIAILSLYADTGCISLLKSSYLPDIISSENIIITLTRIQRRIEATLCKSGKIMELLKSIELDLEKNDMVRPHITFNKV